jgi:hypothetical protein
MQLSSVRALKQQIAANMPLAAQAVEDPRLPPLAMAKGVTRLDPREFGLALRVYEGKEHIAEQAVKFLTRYRREVHLVRGVRYRPRVAVAASTLTSGLSIGHPKITAGTLGGFVHDDDGVYVLSNNHVLANSNRARPYDPILTPGPIDQGASHAHRVIGQLYRWMELREHTPQSLDAAIARLATGTKYQPSYVPGIGRVNRIPIDDRYAVHSVFKLGRTTKLTRGAVSAFEIDDVVVNYGTADKPRWLQFDNQLEFVGAPTGEVFSRAGDSGALIYDGDSRRPYALLFAGGQDGARRDRTLGHFLPDVLAALGVEML